MARSEKSAWKILAALAGVSVLLVVAAVGAGFLWLQNNADTLAEQGKAAMRDGYDFGRGKQATACLDEALARLSDTSGLIAEATNKVWLASCFKSADIPPGFCDDVPPRSEIVQSATWAVGRCEKAGRKDQPCTRLVGAVQERCLAPSP